MSEFEEKIRFGGPQADEEGGDDKQKELERKKAEVRKRLEEQGKAGKKAKKGFLTPERKKKLRKLLMMKAAEDLKQQQLLKEQERQKILAQRIIPMPDVDSCDDQGKLNKIYDDLFAHLCKLEEEKYDINFVVSGKDQEINELTIAVNDLRGKFVKPALKKVSKYDNKFKSAEGGKKGEKADFRSNLKVVKKDNAIDEIMAKTGAKKADKPDWSKKGAEKTEEAPKEEKKEEEAPKEAEPEPEAAPAEEPAAEEEGAEEEEGEEEEEEE